VDEKVGCRVDSQTTLPAAVKSRFLAGLEPTAVATILAAAKVREVPVKQNILAGGEPAAHLFLLRKGRARYCMVTKTGDEIILQWLLPGDVFGLGTLLKHPPNYIGSAEALSDCELLVWTHASIRKLADAYPQLAENGLRIVLHYLKGYANRHVALVTKTSQQRLAGTLLNLGHRTGRVHPHGVEIEATNEQLSALSDISLFTTSRLLSEWEREGTVSKTRGKVLVHTPEALVVE
jgi:CRP/FNR family transcriptional regulator, nitrogen oxide reductase regulator